MSAHLAIYTSLESAFDAALFHHRYYLIRKYGSSQFSNLSDSEIDALDVDILRGLSQWVSHQELLDNFYSDLLRNNPAPMRNKRARTEESGKCSGKFPL